MSAVALAVGVGTSLVGGLISSGSASDAANAQVQAANTASQTQLQMFDQTQANEKPYMDAGQNSLATLMSALGIGGTSPAGTTAGATGGLQTINIPGLGNIQVPSGYGSTGLGSTTATAAPPGGTTAGGNIGFGSLTAPFNYTASPGYNYEVGQMGQAVQNSAAAKGGLVSGNALAALQQNAQGLASTDYTTMANLDMSQKNQLFSMLQTMAGSGQNAAANLGSLGAGTANNISNLQLAAGNANATNATAQGNVLSNLLNNQSFIGGVSSLFGGGAGGSGGQVFSDPSVASLGINPGYA